jgi:predicted nucleotidyltransferase
MDFRFKEGELEFDRELSDLDKQVFDFVSVLEKAGIRYVVISGYVAILLGRSRSTEDVDLFIEKTGFEKFKELANELQKKNYWILNTSDVREAFGYLKGNLALRFAKKGEVIPNFEVKFPKKEMDSVSLEDPLPVRIGRSRIMMSRLEVQIPFKLWLGSEKDIEDAVYIYELFKEVLDKKRMKDVGEKLKVGKRMIKYGIV